MKWYVVQVFTSGEELFKQELLDDAQKSGFANSIEDVVIPEIKTASEGDEVESAEKVFPGYVLVKADMSPELASFIVRQPRAMSFAGGMPPVPLRPSEVERVLDVKAKVKSSEDVVFVVGQEVKIVDGPFAGFFGAVEEFDKESSRLNVGVSIFGRKNSIWLDVKQVEQEE